MSSSKSNFAQTCNLLSQYIKEKGSLRDLNLEIGGKIQSIEAIVKHGSSHSASDSTTDKGKPAQHSSTIKETTGPGVAQLTILYSGGVLVFDDYPADKAEELVAFAEKGGPKMCCGISTNTLAETPRSGAVREGLPPKPLGRGVGITSNTCAENINTAASGGAESLPPASSTVQERGSLQTEANDLPIARRSSLHWFLEKRQDRASARRPYRVQEQPFSSSKGRGTT